MRYYLTEKTPIPKTVSKILKKEEKPYLVFTPADMVWFAVVVPLWPWSHRLICGAVIGLAKRR